MQTKALAVYLVSQYRSLEGVAGQLGINPKLLQAESMDDAAAATIARLLGLTPEVLQQRVNALTPAAAIIVLVAPEDVEAPKADDAPPSDKPLTE